MRTVTDATHNVYDRYPARLFAALYQAQGSARWLDDLINDPLADFCTPIGKQEFLLCQYGLHHALMVDSVTADCSMLCFLRLKDGSLFVIDGG